MASLPNDVGQLRIVADENIPLVEHFFGHLGPITRVPGRQMTAEQVRQADVLLVRSVTAVNASLLQGSSVKFVGTCTIGIDHLDCDYLQQQDIAFASAPGCNARSVTEYVFAALAELEVPWWRQKVGIVGCGNVGGTLYRQLRQLGVECCCYDPFLNQTAIPDLTSLDVVLASDIICLHAPLTHSGPFPTWHLLGNTEIHHMGPGSVLISAGRGAVVDNQALLARLQEQKDLRAVMDVWEPEPQIDTALLQYAELGTPHIAGYSYDGKVAGTAMVYAALCRSLGVEEISRPPVDHDSPLVIAADELMAELPVQRQQAESLLFDIIRKAYNIRRDDQALRDSVVDKKMHAAAFDGLRKNYPVRREFHHWTVSVSHKLAGMPLNMAGGQSKRLDEILESLGFMLAIQSDDRGE